jgi:hypothetical protein
MTAGTRLLSVIAAPLHVADVISGSRA